MNSPLPVRIVSSAAGAIAEAAEWWRINRPSTPDAFITDVETNCVTSGHRRASAEH